MVSRRSLLAFLVAATLTFLTLTGLPSQQAAAASRERETQVVAAILDSRGRPAEGVTLGDLAVLQDGRPAELVSIGPPVAPGDWRLFIYFDYQISSPVSIRRAANVLAREAERLTTLGTVEIVVADPEPHTSLAATRDAEMLELALGRIAIESIEGDELTRLRYTFLEKREGVLADDDIVPEARRALAQELEVLRAQHDALVEWAAAHSAGAWPQGLFLVSDGLGIDSLEFYGPEVEQDPTLAVQAGQFPDLEAVARTLAVYGWTALPLAMSELPRQVRQPLPSMTSDSFDRPEVLGPRLKLGKRDRPSLEETLKETVRRGLEPGGRLQPLARATGGAVLTQAARLAEALVGLEAWRPIRFRSLRTADGDAHTLEIRPQRPDLQVRAPSVVSSATPAAVASARARRLLAGDLEAGTLPLQAAVEVDFAAEGGHQARLEARVGLGPLQEAGVESGLLRVTVAVHREDGRQFVRHELHPLEEAASRKQWTYQSQLRLPDGTDAVAVLVEELQSRLWGSGFAALVSGWPAESGRRAAQETLPAPAPPSPTGASLLPQPKALRLLPPPQQILRGRVRFRARVDEDRVSQVVFYLDGEQVAVRHQPPFDARIDLGSLPRRLELMAVAYDVEGRVVGRDVTILNDTAENFWVRIIEPLGARRVGPVDVEAEVKVPQGRRLDRVEFFWNDRQVATTRHPPFRQRLFIPFDDAVGYIRVAAFLSNGRMADDLVLMNARRFSEQVAVNLVELYVVVTDRRGKPVRGLEEEDFVVREEGTQQDIVTFADAGNLPLTVGLAIDSSASMFIKLPSVKSAAAEFVESLVSEQDRAFVVGFGTEPFVVRATTGDLKAVKTGIRALRPEGRTALWESVVLSLLQLQNVPGRRALVMFFDGADEDEDFRYRTCLNLARQSGVPIYLILMNNEAARTDGMGFRTRSFISKLDRLARAGGGRVYFVRTNQDLGALYQEINKELRSHYLLTYYSDRPARSEAWRDVEVEVKKRGLAARTISGYYARAASDRSPTRRARRPGPGATLPE